MVGPSKKATTSAPPAEKSKEQKPQQQDEVSYSAEFLKSEAEMVRAEQQMGELEVT